MIKHDNIIYVRDISKIGGVETYVYELVKKYHDLDIAVVCRTCDMTQRKRIKKYCPLYIFRNEPIECKVAVINYDTTIIDYLPKRIWKENLKKGSREGIYQGVHADYTHPAMGPLPHDDRIKEYLCITREQMDKFPLMTDAKNYRLCRNPLNMEERDKPMIIVSPTRLTKEKGGDLMLSVANELDRIGTNFLWFVLTTDEYLDNPIFENRNVIWVRNRLDISYFLSIADWVVLPSKCEGDSYTIREALYQGIPIVARHLKYFDEYGIKDGKNALFIDDDNVSKVAKKMLKKLNFKFKPIEDGYEDILIKGKSHYKEKDIKVSLKCNYFIGFDDIQEGRHIKEGEIVEVDEERAEELLSFGCFEVVKEEDNLCNAKSV